MDRQIVINEIVNGTGRLVSVMFGAGGAVGVETFYKDGNEIGPRRILRVVQPDEAHPNPRDTRPRKLRRIM